MHTYAIMVSWPLLLRLQLFWCAEIGMSLHRAHELILHDVCCLITAPWLAVCLQVTLAPCAVMASRGGGRGRGQAQHAASLGG